MSRGGGTHNGFGKTIVGNRANINGMDHTITGNFNNISGMGHIITGNCNKISGVGHKVFGTDNTLSGTGHILNGKSWTSNPSSITTQTYQTRGGRNVTFTQTTDGDAVSNFFGGSLGFNNIQGVSNISNSFNTIGNNVVVSTSSNGNSLVVSNGSKLIMVNGRIVAMNETIDLTSPGAPSPPTSPPKVTEPEKKEKQKEGLYEYNGECKIPTEDALTLDEAVSEEDENESATCVICFERKKKCLVRPCNHLKMCIACSRTIGLQKDPKCPECTMSGESFEIVYQ